MSETIYLDYQATTPIDSKVFEKMKPFFLTKYGNPHSNFHQYGTDASEGVEYARNQIAESINARPEEIIFCSGATEANNLAILKLHSSIRNCTSIITAETEHKCILESCDSLSKLIPIVKLKVKKNGLLDLNLLEEHLKRGKALVSIMLVNNETGVIQNLRQISEIVHKYHSILHTDAAQGFGKIPIDVNDLGIDAMSLSAHKFYGPKGVGAFYVNSELKNILKPLIHGGGQEYKIRSGTVPTPLVVGMGEAAARIIQYLDQNNKQALECKKHFYEIMHQSIKNIEINGCENERIDHNLNLRIPKVEAEKLIINTPGVAFSSGSACTSGEIQSSHVLRSMGLSDQEARESFRISFSHLTTRENASKAAEQIVKSAKKILKYE